MIHKQSLIFIPFVLSVAYSADSFEMDAIILNDISHTQCSYGPTNNILLAIQHWEVFTSASIFQVSADLSNMLIQQDVYPKFVDNQLVHVTAQEVLEGIFIYQIIASPSTEGRRAYTDFNTQASDPFDITCDDEQPNDSTILPSGNVLIVTPGVSEIQGKVYDSDLNVIASVIFDNESNDPPAITSYPAGSDGHFAIASTEVYDLIVRIFDQNGDEDGSILIEAEGDTKIYSPRITTLVSNDLVISYKLYFDGDGDFFYSFQIYNSQNQILSDRIDVAEVILNEDMHQITALADGGFVHVMQVDTETLELIFFDPVGQQFGPSIKIEEEVSLRSYGACSSRTDNLFSVAYAKSGGKLKINQFPIASEDSLTISEKCGETHVLSLSIGGANIDFLVGREVVSEDNYQVLDLTFTGLGANEVTWEVPEDMADKVVEFSYFEAFDETYGNGAIAFSTFDLLNSPNFKNLIDDSCRCDGPSLENEQSNICIDTSELANPALNAFQNNDGTVSLELTLDQVEKENFAGDISWTVTVSGSTDASGLSTVLAAQTGLTVDIPREHFNSDEYIFTATTENGRTAQAILSYELEEEEEDNDKGEFISLKKSFDFAISYRFTDNESSSVNNYDEAKHIQFKFVFSSDFEFIQQCFSYGTIDDDRIQNYECYGVRKVGDSFEPITLNCPRNVNTGVGICTVKDYSEVKLVFRGETDNLDDRRLLQQTYNNIIIQRPVSDDSSNIPSIEENQNHRTFSFAHSEYELDLESIDETSPRQVTFFPAAQPNDDYDFTESAAPIAMLIICIIWLALNAFLFYYSKSLDQSSITSSLEKSSKLRLLFFMLTVSHPLFGVYTYKSPTTSKIERSILYVSRAIAVMLFTNVYMMDKYDTQRFLTSTENSEFTAGFLLFPYVTFLPVIFVLGVLLRGRFSQKEESSKITKMFTILAIALLIFLSFIFTIVIQSEMNEDQRLKTNKGFGQAMFQDLIVTPFLTLILQMVLHCIFYRKGADGQKTSSISYAIVFESVQECMAKRRGEPNPTKENRTQAQEKTDFKKKSNQV